MDLTQGLDFDDGSTDLVQSRYIILNHSLIHRLLAAGVREHQWIPYLKDILRILKPGTGRVQLMELQYPFAICDDGSLPQDAPLRKV